MFNVQQRFRRNYSNAGGGLLLLMIGALVLDFHFRVQVPLLAGALAVDTTLPQLVVAAEPLPWTAPMLAFAERQAPAGSESTESAVPSQQDMLGSSQLGALQVRLKAIFKPSTSPAQATALLESYDPASGRYQITRYRLHDELGDYRLASIEQSRVGFMPIVTAQTSSLIYISVFNFKHTEH